MPSIGSMLELVYIGVLEASAERIESSSLSWPTFQSDKTLGLVEQRLLSGL